MTTSAAAASLEHVLDRRSPLRTALGTRLWTGIAAAVAVSCAITVAGALSSRIPLVYRSTATHVALDTAAGSVALLAAYVLMGRFRWTGRLPDLLSALSLGVLGVTNIAFAVTSAGAADEGSPIRVWTPLVWRFVGALVLGLASVSPERIMRGKRRAAALIGGAVLFVLLGGTLVTRQVSGLPVPQTPPAHRLVAFHPLSISIVQLVSAIVIAGAAAAFGLRGVRRQDDLYRWLSAGCIVFAFARLNYAIFPSLYSSWIYTGDVLRIGFYLIVVIGAVREISRFQRRVAEQAAVIEERRRLARDLHDELAQDLAYIALEARLVLGSIASPRLEQLALAAERALDRSRAAITSLAPTSGTLAESLVAAVEEVAARGDLGLYMDVPTGLDAPPAVRDAFVQIGREAVRNAARHANAQHVWVVLSAERALRLTVADDGTGFAVGAAPLRMGGFGLTSMRERAERIGADLRIESSDIGTTVQVVLR